MFKNIELLWYICVKKIFDFENSSFVYFMNKISILSIVVGVSSCIVVMGIIRNFHIELKSALFSINSHIYINKSSTEVSFFKKNIGNILNLEGIKYIGPLLTSQVIFSGKLKHAGVLLKGVNFNNFPFSNCKFKNNNIFFYFLKKIRYINSQQFFFPIVMGKVLAEKLGVSFGNFVYFSKFSGKGERIFFLPLVVIGILETGVYQYNELLAYTDIKIVSDFLGFDIKLSELEIKLFNFISIDSVIDKIRDCFGFEFLIRNWMDINSNIFLLIKVQVFGMYLILSFLILMISLNVGIVVLISILGKEFEIFVMKTIGLPISVIRKVFILKQIIIIFFGNLLGILLGIILCNLINFFKTLLLSSKIYLMDLNNIYFYITLKMLVFILFFSFFICLFFTLCSVCYMLKK